MDGMKEGEWTFDGRRAAQVEGKQEFETKGKKLRCSDGEGVENEKEVSRERVTTEENVNGEVVKKKRRRKSRSSRSSGRGEEEGARKKPEQVQEVHEVGNALEDVIEEDGEKGGEEELCWLLLLPCEIVLHIFKYLHISDLRAIQAVCYDFHRYPSTHRTRVLTLILMHTPSLLLPSRRERGTATQK